MGENIHETKNAMWRRDEQLRRWEISDTNQESDIPRKNRNVSTVHFNECCVFLAACISSDTDEISRLLARGVNINTSNIDGLTALHQACIDDNIAMVKFLVENGADINAADNEGWTSLHAAASCGFLKITKYLLSHGAKIDAVNNDGELALDLAEGSEVEKLLTETMKSLGINADEARGSEEEIMLRDAEIWLRTGHISDLPHQTTGATAIHIAATKGYINVLKILLDCDYSTEVKDFDGWTPLHAAAHWGQIEACQLLCKNNANLNSLNNWGQTPLDVCDSDIESQLKDLLALQNYNDRNSANINILPNTQPNYDNTLKPLEIIALDIKGSKIKNSELKENLTSQSCIQNPSSLKDITKSSSPPKKNQVLSFPVITEQSKSNNGFEEIGRKIEDVSSTKSSAVSMHTNGAKYDVGINSGIGKMLTIYTATTVSSPQVSTPATLASGVLFKNATERQEPSDIKKSLDAGSEEARNRFNALYNRYTALLNSNMVVSKAQNGEEGLSSSLSSTKKDFTKQISDEKLDINGSTSDRRSFEIPKKDDEKEVERKVKAKRNRETRRSTQGIVQSDVEMAEQSIKTISNQVMNVPISNAEATTNTTNLITAIEGNVASIMSSHSTNNDSPDHRLSAENSQKMDLLLKNKDKQNSESKALTETQTDGKGEMIRVRRKREGRSIIALTQQLQNISEDTDSKSDLSLDFKKLYEEECHVSDRLRKQIDRLQSEATENKATLELSKANLSYVNLTPRNGTPPGEKTMTYAEKRILLRKIAELEEELKSSEMDRVQLQENNQRLKEENSALIRVISKLSR